MANGQVEDGDLWRAQKADRCRCPEPARHVDRRPVYLLAAGAALSATACVDKEQSQKLMKSFETGPQHPDEAPKMLNKELPFNYPPALYAKKVQGNVTLRLFIDRDGHVRPDSTQVVESSGYASFDSAAIRGSQELQFVPAKTKGEPQAVTICVQILPPRAFLIGCRQLQCSPEAPLYLLPARQPIP